MLLTLNLVVQGLVEMLTDPGVGVPEKFPNTSADVVYEYCTLRVGFFLGVIFPEEDWDPSQIRSFNVDYKAASLVFPSLLQVEGQVEDAEEVLILGESHISAMEVHEQRPAVRGVALRLWYLVLDICEMYVIPARSPMLSTKE
ncbi:hypothetical protein BDK51DRAFT_33657 [Blyttiomyces helicus]|uniref:Uncharacterized protein n=1 Tax=Blyttiomyces helicus TaxID=388810 RepID=A0A4P9WNB7_9FUNG|nr:hypothetical protein BDK51DRAFT_33657 [Blyttiomyces helicus]|eukprot:RKO94611.1 hypothetical protein BDK51DRAFT_33657 [Blyttiomyces helicus]